MKFASRPALSSAFSQHSRRDGLRPGSARPLSVTTATTIDIPRTLAVSAHPDEAGFGCAGSIADWVAEGADEAYLLAA